MIEIRDYRASDSEALADIFRQETEHKVAVFLEQCILTAITPVSLGIGQMLRAIQLDRNARLRIKQVNFHLSVFVKGDG